MKLLELKMVLAVLAKGQVSRGVEEVELVGSAAEEAVLKSSGMLGGGCLT